MFRKFIVSVLVGVIIVSAFPLSVGAGQQQAPDVAVSCDSSGDLVITWNNNSSLFFYIAVDGPGQNYPAVSGLITFAGPATFSVLIQWQTTTLFDDLVTCNGTPVEFVPPTPCDADGRLNHSCAAPIIFYLAQMSDGWLIYGYEVVEGSGELYALLTPEDIAGLDDDGTWFGDLFIRKWDEDTYFAHFPMSDSKIYWILFRLDRDDPWVDEGEIQF
jgi:hypothetical protein